VERHVRLLAILATLWGALATLVGLSMLLLAALLLTPAAPAGAQSDKIGGTMILATTTSTVDSGLLEALMPKFKDKTGVEVKVIGIGSGAALAMGAKGDADAVLSHAPAAEQKYVDKGDFVEGALIMHNDFILLGPPSDPAEVKAATSLKDALARIAAAGPFISRGDDSGTHKMELALWKDAGIGLSTVKNREEAGQGMGAVLNIANQRKGYTLADRGTYLALRKSIDLDVVYEGESALLNIYHAYVVNPARHGGIKLRQARAFLRFMVAPDTQRFIGEFRKAEFGQALFEPDAGKSVANLGKKR
jgi:tungstate transport system substrate-binding protein